MSISTSQMILFSPDPPQAGSSEVVTRFTMSFTTELKGVYRTSYLTESGLKARLTIQFKIPGEDDGDLGDACQRAHLTGIDPYGHAPLVVNEIGYWGSTYGYANPSVDDFVVYANGSSDEMIRIDFPCNNLSQFFTWPSAVVFVDPETTDPDAEPIEFKVIAEVSGGTEEYPFNLDTLTEKEIGNYYLVVTEGWFSVATKPEPFLAQVNKIIVWLANGRVVVTDLGATGTTNVELKLDRFTDVKVSMQLVIVVPPDPLDFPPLPREIKVKERFISLTSSGSSEVTASEYLEINGSDVAEAVDNVPGAYDLFWRIYKYSGTMEYSATCNGGSLPEVIKDQLDAGSTVDSALLTSDVFAVHALVTTEPYPFFIGDAPYFNINTGGDSQVISIKDKLIRHGTIDGYWTAQDGTILSWSGSSVIMGARMVLQAPATVRCACIVKIGTVEYIQVLAANSTTISIYSHALIVGYEWEKLSETDIPKKTVKDFDYKPNSAYWSFNKSGTKCMSFCLGKVCVVWEADVDANGTIGTFIEAKTLEFANDLVVTANFNEESSDSDGWEYSSNSKVFDVKAMLCAFYKDDTLTTRTAVIQYATINQNSTWNGGDKLKISDSINVIISVRDNDADVFSFVAAVGEHVYEESAYGDFPFVCTGEITYNSAYTYSITRDEALIVKRRPEHKYTYTPATDCAAWVKAEVSGIGSFEEKECHNESYDTYMGYPFFLSRLLPPQSFYYSKLYNKDELLIDVSADNADINFAVTGTASMAYDSDAPNAELLAIAKGYSSFFGLVTLSQIPTAVAQNTRFIAATAIPLVGVPIYKGNVGGTELNGFTSLANFQVTSPRACVFKPDPDLSPKPETL